MWASVPADAPLQVILRRSDLDNLFLSIRECIIGQSDLSSCLQALTHGDTESAQKHFDAALLHQRNAISQIDNLVMHAMTTAKPVQNG
ncbi:hypothetical protein [Mesorhizobium huakuii]|uniref:Uncharacterized protein n=1 Tax=Mesorhizobium huakuii TaxID=28104 RepID=A0A7G6T2B6_9HYPH|nr:hypothetical protein [Mesorhizobium huakuii]QND60898.1 hypothetical protein HB778_33750 [Mesorhizobium huakuii]